MKNRIKIIAAIILIIIAIIFGMLIYDIDNQVSIINTKNIYLEKSINNYKDQLKEQQDEINSLKRKIAKQSN